MSRVVVVYIYGVSFLSDEAALIGETAVVRKTMTKLQRRTDIKYLYVYINFF